MARRATDPSTSTASDSCLPFVFCPPLCVGDDGIQALASIYCVTKEHADGAWCLPDPFSIFSSRICAFFLVCRTCAWSESGCVHRYPPSLRLLFRFIACYYRQYDVGAERLWARRAEITDQSMVPSVLSGYICHLGKDWKPWTDYTAASSRFTYIPSTCSATNRVDVTCCRHYDGQVSCPRLPATTLPYSAWAYVMYAVATMAGGSVFQVVW